MARTRTRTKRTAMETATLTAAVPLKFVRLELPIESHRLLRLEAARQERSMAQMSRIIVEDYLSKQKGGMS